MRLGLTLSYPVPKVITLKCVGFQSYWASNVLSNLGKGQLPVILDIPIAVHASDVLGSFTQISVVGENGFGRRTKFAAYPIDLHTLFRVIRIASSLNIFPVLLLSSAYRSDYLSGHIVNDRPFPAY